MTPKPNLSRRDFLKISAGAGLVIGITLTGCQREPDEFSLPTLPESTSPPDDEPESVKFQPNAFLKIEPSGEITVIVSKPELGQGVRTAIPMIIAEELGADWDTIRVEQAPASNEYGSQVVGGSKSISGLYPVLRSAGIMARGLLLAAAAQTWEVDPGECTAEKNIVTHGPSGRQLSFGELALTAATVETPASAAPVDPADYQIIGTSVPRVDDPRFVDGSAVFGSDIVLPGMLYAVLARSPVHGGKILSYDDSLTKMVQGIRHVVQIEETIAVVAETTWAAIRGRKGLEITWSNGTASIPSKGIPESLGLKMIAAEQAEYYAKRNQVRAAKLAALAPVEVIAAPGQEAEWFEVDYEIPHFAHVTMEPMTCTADIREDFGEVWAPTQDPGRAVVRRAAGLADKPESFRVNIPLIGGGFGRRLEVDYVTEAVLVSKAVGAPVKLVWTREDDIQHDYFHQGGTVKVRALLNPPMMPRISASPLSTPLKTGAWRSVENFNEAFARECFIDEYAEALGRDPVDLRLELYQDERMKAVLEKAATEANWGSPIPTGTGRGIACYATWDVTPVAEIAEVSVALDGTIRVNKVVCVVDPGLVIHPDMVVQQMESGIAFALSAALKNKITHEGGRVQQTNFEDYPILRFDEMPEVEVHILASDRNPSGVGEMGGPPLAPAVCNALYNLTGQRIRKLPIRLDGE